MRCMRLLLFVGFSRLGGTTIHVHTRQNHNGGGHKHGSYPGNKQFLSHYEHFLWGKRGDYYKLGLLIVPISILLICSLIFYVIGIYTDRINIVKNSLKRIQKNEIISFTFKTKYEIGEMMLEIEEVSNRLNTQDKEMKEFQEEKLLLANTDSFSN